MSVQPNGWTLEQDVVLKRLRDDGLSASQIAASLQHIRPGVEKNGAIGRLHRLGLSVISSKPGAPKSPAKAQRKNPISVAALKALPASPISFPARKPIGGVSLFKARWVDGRPAQCRWPLNDAYPVDAFRFCGVATADGASWCPAHRKMVYGRYAREQEAAE